MNKVLHPFCNACGWRKGGLDSWDGNKCKCGHYAPPMPAIYLVCPVRNVTPELSEQIAKYVSNLEKLGANVHYPPRDVDQNDPTGERICRAHLAAMERATEVHVYWDVESKGSHFDIGMAYALGKKIVPVFCVRPDSGKSYWKVMNIWAAKD